MRKILIVATLFLCALSGQAQEKVIKVLKKDGSYSDNHYSVSEPSAENKNQGKKEESPKQATTLFGTFKNILHIDYILPVIACQAVKQDFFYFQSGVVP